jgi:hypothetical protein
MHNSTKIITPAALDDHQKYLIMEIRTLIQIASGAIEEALAMPSAGASHGTVAAIFLPLKRRPEGRSETSRTKWQI